MVKVPFHEFKIGDWISMNTYPDIDYTTSILGNIARVATVTGQSVGIEGKKYFQCVFVLDSCPFSISEEGHMEKLIPEEIFFYVTEI